MTYKTHNDNFIKLRRLTVYFSDRQSHADVQLDTFMPDANKSHILPILLG